MSDAVATVDELIAEAVRLKASHIHVEPEEHALQVRVRIDGLLHKQAALPKDRADEVIARLKSISGIDPAQTRIPQQGRLEVKGRQQPVVFVVSTCPTLHGENVVLSVQENAAQVRELDALGLSGRDLRRYKDLINSGCGIMFVAGPAGSGTTTTLYASLQMLRNGNRNIMAVEDEVAWPVAGIRQVAVSGREGLSFASVLRSFVQQDPDVIFAGEIRDKESAEVSVGAALTGRLVFSQVHTDDACSALTRLIDMGVDPFLASPAMLGVLSQRLVRRICDDCKVPYHLDAQRLREFGLENRKGAVQVSRGQGCVSCAHTGYRGWLGVFGLLVVSAPIQQLMLKRADSAAIRKLAEKEGMRTVRQAAIEKMLLGLTSPEEVMRVENS